MPPTRPACGLPPPPNAHWQVPEALAGARGTGNKKYKTDAKSVDSADEAAAASSAEIGDYERNLTALTEASTAKQAKTALENLTLLLTKDSEASAKGTVQQAAVIRAANTAKEPGKAEEGKGQEKAAPPAPTAKTKADGGSGGGDYYNIIIL